MTEVGSIAEENSSVRTEDSDFTKELYFSDWEVKARMEQTFFYLTLGDRVYDVYAENESHLMLKKIAFAIHGPPVMAADRFDTSDLAGYSEPQKVTSTFVHKKVAALGTPPVQMAVIFVCVESKNSKKSRLAAVFRIRKAGGGASFVDSYGKCYDCWRDFLATNRIPVARRFCYPVGGFYSCEKSTEYTYRDWGLPKISFGFKEGLPEGAAVAKRWFVGRSSVDVFGLCGETRFSIEAAMKAPINANFGDKCGASSSAEFVKELLQCDLYCEFPGSNFERRTSYRCLHGLPLDALRLNTVMIVLEIAYLVEYFRGRGLSLLDRMRFASGALFFVNEVVDVRTLKRLVKWGATTDALPPGPSVRIRRVITGDVVRAMVYINDAEPFNNFRKMKLQSISGIAHDKEAT